jgi:hypothetical protein
MAAAPRVDLLVLLAIGVMLCEWHVWVECWFGADVWTGMPNAAAVAAVAAVGPQLLP